MRIRTLVHALAGTVVLDLALCIGAGAALAQTPAPGVPAGPSVGVQAAASNTGPEPTAFIVRFKIKPGQNAEFEKIMAKVQSALPKSEPGNLSYDLYVPSRDSQTYVLIERYRDALAVSAHGKDKAVQDMFAALKDVLDGDMKTAIQAERLILVSSKPTSR